jgi:hypothetical protein
MSDQTPLTILTPEQIQRILTATSDEQNKSSIDNSFESITEPVFLEPTTKLWAEVGFSIYNETV